MNKLILIGNLTRDPETRTTPSGHTVCNFDLAVNDHKGDTTFFRISVWGKQGEICQRFLSKGRKVFVTGPVSARTYQTSGGETRVSLEVTANETEFLSPKDAEGAYKQQERQAIQQEPQMQAVETEELPF